VTLALLDKEASRDVLVQLVQLDISGDKVLQVLQAIQVVVAFLDLPAIPVLPDFQVLMLLAVEF